MSSSALRVRHVLAGEHAALRKIRLASLAADPKAFDSMYACDSAQALEWWEGLVVTSGSFGHKSIFVPKPP